MNKRTAQLKYNPETDRLEHDGNGLCCGWPLEVLVPSARGGKWVETRLEYAHDGRGWYLVGLADLQPNGLWARL